MKEKNWIDRAFGDAEVRLKNAKKDAERINYHLSIMGHRMLDRWSDMVGKEATFKIIEFFNKENLDEEFETLLDIFFSSGYVLGANDTKNKKPK